MANLWCDGFGRYGDDEAKMLNGSSGQAWAQVDSGGSSWNLSTANPRTGTHHMRLSGGTDGKILRRVFGAAKTEVFFGCALSFDTLPISEPVPGSSPVGFHLASFRSASNAVQFTVFLGTDGGIVVYRRGLDVFGDFSGTLLHRSDPIVGAGAYQHFEHYLKVDNTVGAYELRIDEQTIVNLTGIDTDYSSGEVSQVAVGRTSGNPFPSGNNVDLADCYANDTVDDGSGCDSFVGDVKSGVKMVNADTAQADFVLSAGASGYDLLDEKGPDDATYISTSSSTAQSNFGFEDGPANMSEILTIRPFNRALKDDAGTCLIAPSLISNGDKAVVTPQPITTAAAYYDSNVPLNPDTGVPWTPAEFNAALAVVERTA